jgi:FHS family L-fucose permease-like MFS transporter
MGKIMSMQNPSKSSYVIPMAIIGSLFFIFGFVTWLNGSLIPFLKIVLDLTQFQALFVTFAFYIAYTIMALPAAGVLQRTGYRKGMMIGLLLIAAGALVFIPAAYTRVFALFLTGLFIMGTGLTILQTASNPYVVRLGPNETAAVRISIMGLLNKGAGIAGPVIFTALILSGMSEFSEENMATLNPAAQQDKLNELAGRLVVPYIGMAVILVLLAAAVMFSPLPDIQEEESELEEVLEEKNGHWGILKYPQAVLGAIALFFYVGVEVIAGDTIGLYGKQVGVDHFGSLTSYTMAFMVVGYILGMITIPRLINQSQALLLSAVFGALFCIGILVGSNESHLISEIIFGWMGIATVPNSVMFLALAGLANALVWPAIWPLALTDLGKHTPSGAALLIMGISGGALLPLLYGYLSDATGNSQSAYWMMIPCYLFIFFYAVKGHKVRAWGSNSK